MLLQPEVDAAAVALPAWVQIVGALGPPVTLAAALLAGAIALATLQQRRAADADALAQRRAADAKAEWWRRTEWAFDRILAGDPAHEDVGTAALGLLQASELATEEDLDLLRTGWDAVLGRVPDDAAAYRSTDAPTAPRPHVRSSAVGATVEVTRAQVRAARGRVDADRRLGRPTPEWVRRVAGATSGPG